MPIVCDCKYNHVDEIKEQAISPEFQSQKACSLRYFSRSEHKFERSTTRRIVAFRSSRAMAITLKMQMPSCKTRKLDRKLGHGVELSKLLNQAQLDIG